MSLFVFVGPMGTNTSKEIEELHRALQEVGMSRTLPGLESHNASGKEQAALDGAADSRRPGERYTCIYLSI